VGQCFGSVLCEPGDLQAGRRAGGHGGQEAFRRRFEGSEGGTGDSLPGVPGPSGPSGPSGVSKLCLVNPAAHFSVGSCGQHLENLQIDRRLIYCRRACISSPRRVRRTFVVLTQVLMIEACFTLGLAV
jgi:hypothetical protein